MTRICNNLLAEGCCLPFSYPISWHTAADPALVCVSLSCSFNKKGKKRAQAKKYILSSCQKPLSSETGTPVSFQWQPQHCKVMVTTQLMLTNSPRAETDSLLWIGHLGKRFQNHPSWGDNRIQIFWLNALNSEWRLYGKDRGNQQKDWLQEKDQIGSLTSIYLWQLLRNALQVFLKKKEFKKRQRTMPPE